MKNIKYIIIFLSVFFISILNVSAASITETKYDNDNFVISGNGTGEIQVVLFDKTNNPVYMSTVTSKDGEYKLELPKIDNLTEGDYTFKVSDYDGKNIDSKVVKVNFNINNPKTYDNVNVYIIISILSFVGIIVCKKQLKKN